MPDWTTAFAPQKFMPALHGALADISPHFNPVDMSPGKPADAGLAAMGFGQAPPLMQGAASPPAAGGLAGTGGGPMQPTQAMPQAAPAAPQAQEQRYMMSGPVGDYMRSNQGAMFNLAAGLLGGRQGLQQAVANMPQAMAGDRDKARRAEQNAAIQQWLGSQTDLDPRTAALYRAFPQLAAQQAFAQPDATTLQKNYQMARDQGFAGSFMDYQMALKRAGATNVKVGGNDSPFQFGDPEKGWYYGVGEDGVPYAKPVPGTDQAKDVERAQSAAETKAVDTSAEAGRMSALIGDILSLEDEVDNPNMLSGTNSQLNPVAWHSDSVQGRLRSKVDGLKSGVALNALLRLKESSPTGASGFGALNKAELQLLLDKFGALDPRTTSWPELKRTLQETMAHYNRVVEDIRREVEPWRIKELGLDVLWGSAGSAAPNDPLGIR